MTWTLPLPKLNEYRYAISTAAAGNSVTEKELQSINGYLNVIVTHTPILKCWRAEIITEMERAKLSPEGVQIKPQTRACLYNWLRILESLEEGFPITPPPQSLPDFHYVIDSDAAGLARGRRLQHEIGAGYVLSRHPDGRILKTGQAFWDNDFIQNTYDMTDKFFGAKSTALETAALIYPLYHNRRLLAGKRVVINCDNANVRYAFEKGRSSSDPFTTMFIQALILCLTSMECQIKIVSLLRCSTDKATLADTLTRNDAKAHRTKSQLRSFEKGDWPRL